MLMSLLWCYTSLKTISTCTQGAVLILTTHMTNELSTSRLGCKAAPSTSLHQYSWVSICPPRLQLLPGLPTCPYCPASPTKMGWGIKNIFVQCFWAVTQSIQKCFAESKDLSKVSESSLEKQTTYEHPLQAPALSLVLNSVLSNNTGDLCVSVFQLLRFPKKKLPQELPVIWEHGWTRARNTRAEIEPQLPNSGSGGTEHPGTPLPNSVLGANVPRLSQGHSVSRLIGNLKNDYRNQETELLLWIAAILHKRISFLLLRLLIWCYLYFF